MVEFVVDKHFYIDLVEGPAFVDIGAGAAVMGVREGVGSD
jgi:hypothetical protein